MYVIGGGGGHTKSWYWVLTEYKLGEVTDTARL